MPRNVRNFWLELTVDGKTSRVETGPQSKDGGFQLTIKMRDEGDITIAASIVGVATDGKLALMFRPELATDEHDGDICIHTKR